MNVDQLAQELRNVGRAIDVPPIDTEALTAHTMARLADSRTRTAAAGASVLRRRWRAVVGVVAALLLVLALTPPVRAAVADWFGVVLRFGPPAEDQSVPPADSELTLDEARELIGFEPVLPEMLGSPEGIEVSADGSVLSMTWSADDGSVTRIDQFANAKPTFIKEIQYAAETIIVDGETTLWFDGPHHVIRIDSSGQERVETARSSGPTLIFPVGELTVRIEGLDRSEAVAVARSILGTD